MTVQELLRRDSGRLQEALGLEATAARIEVQCLLQAVLGVARAWLYAHPEHVPEAAAKARYSDLLARRLEGEPVAYLLGCREFFGLDFKVTSATLIPRPDTELLVELALQRIPDTVAAGSFHVLDMGTGSGAIALAIAHTRPDISVVAVDASSDALRVAGENAGRLGVKNVRLLSSDWFAALAGARYDLIVSNPPYIVEADQHLSRGDLRFEPLAALASGADGLDDIRRIVDGAPTHLKPGGWLMLEHGYDQAERVRQLLLKAGFAGVVSARDLAGIERASFGQL